MLARGGELFASGTLVMGRYALVRSTQPEARGLVKPRADMVPVLPACFLLLGSPDTPTHSSAALRPLQRKQQHVANARGAGQ